MPIENIFNLPSRPLSEEHISILSASEGMRIERIVSTGQTSGWYNQDENEFVSLLQGEAELTWEDGSKTRLSSGDFITIPSNKLHRVSYTSCEPACIWLCVFWK